MAKTLSSAIIYGPTLPVAGDSVDGALFYKTNDVGTPSGLYMFGFIADSSISLGSQVSQTWQRTLGSLGSGGALDTAAGGTGSVGPYNAGGLVWASTNTSMGSTAVGTAGQLLVSGGAGAPTWTSQGALSVSSASTLSTPRTISLSGVTATPTPFDGSANISIPISGVPASLLSGTVAAARLSGTYTIDISGTATNANSANAAATALQLTNSRNISLSGDATGSASFNGTANAAITVTVNGFLKNITDTLTGTLTITNTVISGLDGTNGYTKLAPGSSTRTGQLEFHSATNVRQGYIGFSPTSTADNGALVYTGGSHNFTGPILSTGNITAYSSDGRLKKNATLIQNAVQKVLSLGGYAYDWDMVKCLEVGFKPENEHEHGLIAQDVQRVMPDAVAPAPFNDQYLTVRYERIVALLTAALGEQQQEIELLKTRLTVLETKENPLQ